MDTSSTTLFTESETLLSFRPICKVYPLKPWLSRRRSVSDLWIQHVSQQQERESHAAAEEAMSFTHSTTLPLFPPQWGTFPWGACKAADFPSFPFPDPQLQKRWELPPMNVRDEERTNRSEGLCLSPLWPSLPQALKGKKHLQRTSPMGQSKAFYLNLQKKQLLPKLQTLS